MANFKEKEVRNNRLQAQGVIIFLALMIYVSPVFAQFSYSDCSIYGTCKPISSVISSSSGGNFTKAEADTYYADIKWGYNMTSSASGMFNQTYADWAYNQTDATYNLYNAIWSSTSNSTYYETTSSWNGNYSSFSKFWYNMSTSTSSFLQSTGFAAENITSGTIDILRLPSLTNSYTLNASNITVGIFNSGNWAFGENLTIRGNLTVLKNSNFALNISVSNINEVTGRWGTCTWRKAGGYGARVSCNNGEYLAGINRTSNFNVTEINCCLI